MPCSPCRPSTAAALFVSMSARARVVMMIAWAAATAACGPGLETMHESNLRFEHCYRLDMDPDIAGSHRLVCWRDWTQTYAYGQPRDRVEYARRRIITLESGDVRLLDIRGQPLQRTRLFSFAGAPSSTAAAPAPTSAHAPPPSTTAAAPGPTSAHAPPPSTAPDDRAKQEPVDEFPGDACSRPCGTAYETCAAGCRDQAEVCAKCREDYRTCMRRCFE